MTDGTPAKSTGPRPASTGRRTGAIRASRRPRPAAPAALTPQTRIEVSGLPGAGIIRRTGGRLGIRTVEDLLFHVPRRHDDLREMHELAELQDVDDGVRVSARVVVRGIRVEPTFRRRVQRVTAYLGDASGEAEAIWFGRRFIERRLHEGDRIVVSGRIKHRGFALTFDNPEFQADDGSALLHAGRIVPVYRLTAGLTLRTLRASIRAALDRLGGYPEYLPLDLLRREDIDGIAAAVEQVHYPETFESLDRALRRLAFDELLALQVGMIARRRERTGERGSALTVSEVEDAAIRSSIRTCLELQLGRRVELTPDQRSAMDTIRADASRAQPMLRLLQGDVGSGKTAVAAYGMAVAARAGHQAALLAPTDLLARQHAVTLAELLADRGLNAELLTGSLRTAARRAALSRIASGEAAIVVGTHALIQEDVTFARLGLVVIDEQHRFGVEQRGQLEAKAGHRVPHVLLMTATPIPRTLGQVFYADLDVSDLRTPPSGRLAVRTAIRGTNDLDRLWGFVRAEAERGHGIFVVVPLIEESEDETSTAAEAEAARLSDLLAPLRIGLVHGRMKPAQRDEEMSRFRAGEIDVLVGTTVVEVGVDIPRATVMVVENAERFGLAQLHQLRGRVGRGTEQSFCALVSDVEPGTVGRARLEAVESITDGFELAEVDFSLRREGDVLGVSQSGLPRLRVASLQDASHRELAVRARAQAEQLVDEAGRLRAGQSDLERVLDTGWLARVAAGDPAPAP